MEAERLKQLFIVDIGNGRCLTHDGHIQLGVFKHSVERHLEMSNDLCGGDPIDWQVTYWMPDPFCIRYKRINYQHTMKANEGSPKTDNSSDYNQPESRLERTL